MNFIGKYEIVATLGRGSMGVVYKGRDPEIGRLVAIKTLKSMFMGNDPAGNEALQRFRQEARSAGKLHHPNIVTIFEAGRTDTGSPYIVMEYIEGNSLENMIAEHKPLDPYAVLHYLSQIAGAIDYAHSQSVIHRDLKPSNILIDGHYRAHLLDFGVAKLSDTSLTPAGTVVGTPSYMSPEQIRGQPLDGRTDVFSLAVVAFEGLTGVRPFPGNDFTTVVSNIIHKEPLAFREVGSTLPEALERALHWGLAKEREERCANSLEFVARLAGILGTAVDGGGLTGGFDPDRFWSPEKAAASPGRGGALSSLFDEQKLQDHKPEPDDPALLKHPEEPQAPAPQRSAVPAASKRSRGIFGPLICVLVLACAFAGAAYWYFQQPRPEKSGQAADEPPPTGVPSAAPDPTRTVSSPPAAPAGGFDKTGIAGLRDDELLVLLRWPKTDLASLRLAVPEAAKRNNKEFAEPLLDLLGHQDLVIRVEALKALSKDAYLQDDRVMVRVIGSLDDPEPLIRGFAAKALVRTGHQNAKQALERRLNEEKSEVVQKVIKDSLQKMH